MKNNIYNPNMLISGMRAAFLLATCYFFAVPPGLANSGADIRSETFAYPDGLLKNVSGGAWRAIQGAAMARVEGGALVLDGANEGKPSWVCRAFPEALDGGTRATVILQVRFDGPLSGNISKAIGVPLVQFTEAKGNKRRGRLFMLPADGGESINLGVTVRGLESRKVQWATRTLPLAEEHMIVFSYDGDGGVARLWINPTADTSIPDAEIADSAETMIPACVSFENRSNWPMGRVIVRSITIGEPPGGGGFKRPSMKVSGTATSKPASNFAGAPTWRTAGSAVKPPSAGKFYIFLLAGQSNMAGRGTVEEIDRTPNPRILAYAGPGRWILATEPLHNDKTSARVGPGFAFARALLKNLPPDASIGLIPAAFGGSPIAEWHKDYNGPARWRDGRTYFQTAVEAARDAAKQGMIAGIIWNQGEGDGSRASRDGGAQYRAQVDELIAAFRAALGNPDLPFVAATLGPWRRPTTKDLNQVYLDLPSRVARTGVVDTLDPKFGGKLRNKPNDQAHYDTPSARLLGEGYAEAILPLLQ
jgi:hypothetical protein